MFFIEKHPIVVMLFRDVAQHFSRIGGVSSRLEMTKLLVDMLEELPADEIDKAIYLSQGVLGAGYKAAEIGLGENLMITAISKATGYGSKEVEALYKKKGDLGTVVEEIADKKKQKSLFTEQLSLGKVFANFEKIASSAGHGSQDLKIKLMAELFNSASPLEARYIARIPIGKMRLGIGDPTIMDGLAIIYSKEFLKNKAAAKEIEAGLKEKNETKRKKEFDLRVKQKIREIIEEKYNIHSDLGDIAKMLKKKGLKGVDEIEISTGVPIRPTLAERLPTAEEIAEKLGKCLVESKYDGFRLQVHKNGNDVVIFSRQSENVTHMFPEIVAAVKEQIKAKKAIFEGEALAYNEETQEYQPFQITIQRKRKYDIAEKSREMPLKLFAFDVMMVEERNVMPQPLSERRKILSGLISRGQTIELTKSIVTDSPKEIEKFFEASIEAGLEGIIAKDLNARYIAGARKFSWIKLKRSYRGELSDSVDVVIVGYYAGRGKRAEFGLGGLLTCVYDDSQDEFRSIAKIGTGMTEQHMKELHSMLSKERLAKKPTRVVSGLEPDHWCNPMHVIEVRADEITRSPVHTAGKTNAENGLALRFPRMVSFRNDKNPEQATTVKEIMAMYRKQKTVKVEEEK